MQRKKCDLCGRKDGLIEVHVYYEQKPQKLSLCTSCAIKILEDNPSKERELSALMEKGGQAVFQMITEMRSLLSEIASQIHTIETQRAKKVTKQCLCGLTQEDFKENGYLGCPWCYETFKENIHSLLVDIERSSTHKGIIPPRYTYLMVIQKEIDYLRRRLKHLISQEAYEEAAKVHRRLKRILCKTEWNTL